MRANHPKNALGTTILLAVAASALTFGSSSAQSAPLSCARQGQTLGDGRELHRIDKRCFETALRQAKLKASRTTEDEARSFRVVGFENILYTEVARKPGAGKSKPASKEKDWVQPGLKILSGAQSGLRNIIAILPDPWAREVFVLDAPSDDTEPTRISVFALGDDGNIAPRRSYPAEALHGASSISVSAEKLILANPEQGKILFFSKWVDIHGRKPVNQPSLETLRSTKAGISSPVDAIVDQGELIVADPGTQSIYIFPENARGDVEPIRRIHGPNTRLHAPQAVFVWHDGSILVINGDRDQTQLVFPRKADGNISPSAVNPAYP